MPLPKANYPVYDFVIPSTKKKIKARPFLVKENKVILQAIEMGDQDNFINAIKNVIAACTFNEVNTDNLTMYDVDYLFLQIRAKSVGEISDVRFTCRNDVLNEETQQYKSCDASFVMKVDVSSAEVVFPPEYKETKIVMVDEHIGIKLKAPTFEVFQSLKTTETGLDRDFAISDIFLFSCIESVFDSDSVRVPVKDFTLEELSEFVDSLSEKTLQEIESFFKEMPYVGLTLNVRCPSCGNKSTIEYKGLEDFFG